MHAVRAKAAYLFRRYLTAFGGIKICCHGLVWAHGEGNEEISVGNLRAPQQQTLKAQE